MGSDVSWHPFRSPEVLFENSIEVGEGLFPAVFRSIHTSRGTCSPRLHDRLPFELLPFELCLAPFEKPEVFIPAVEPAVHACMIAYHSSYYHSSYAWHRLRSPRASNAGAIHAWHRVCRCE
jgi:hypothetical protein